MIQFKTVKIHTYGSASPTAGNGFEYVNRNIVGNKRMTINFNKVVLKKYYLTFV